MKLPLTDHPRRYELSNELHARPFPDIEPPCLAICLAIKPAAKAVDRDRNMDRAHLVALLERNGAPHPAPDAIHYSGEIAGRVLKWEIHTEFVSYTLFVPKPDGDPFDVDLSRYFPSDWLAKMPGVVLTSSIVHIETVEPDRFGEELETRFKGRFVADSLAVSRVGGDAALVAGDFRIDPRGHTRFLVLCRPGVDQTRLGRLVQRLLELENYKSMAMLGLPVARDVAAKVVVLDRELSDCVAGMAEGRGEESETLDRLLRISAEIESLSSASAFRFGAAQAYEAIVTQRIAVLRETRERDWQMFGEFMMRRFDPAMRTCRSSKARLDELSARAERAANLLRTRVDVENQEQNTEVLHQMDRRAAMQLRLQETVEGLSVVAISYYAVNLAAGLVGPLGERVGISKTTMLALLTLPVIGLVWYMVRRIRNRISDR